MTVKFFLKSFRDSRSSVFSAIAKEFRQPENISTLAEEHVSPKAVSHALMLTPNVSNENQVETGLVAVEMIQGEFA